MDVKTVFIVARDRVRPACGPARRALAPGALAIGESLETLSLRMCR